MAEGDGRRAPRHRTLKKGVIVLHNKLSTFECVVRNLSATGAQLKVASVIGIPERFDLQFDGVTRSARVAWRRASELGVEFTDAA